MREIFGYLGDRPCGKCDVKGSVCNERVETCGVNDASVSSSEVSLPSDRRGSKRHT